MAKNTAKGAVVKTWQGHDHISECRQCQECIYYIASPLYPYLDLEIFRFHLLQAFRSSHNRHVYRLKSDSHCRF